MLILQQTADIQFMLFLTVLSLLALPSALGGLVTREQGVDQLGCDSTSVYTVEKGFAKSFTGMSTHQQG
jgi:hypothetical protein